ncbi:hypothetical protein ACFL2Q_02820 [Thermodesulfobacteriota bacterium]
MEITNAIQNLFSQVLDEWPMHNETGNEVVVPTVYLSAGMILVVRWILAGANFFRGATWIHRIKGIIECPRNNCKICQALEEQTTGINKNVIARYRCREVILAYSHVVRVDGLKKGIRADSPILLVAPASLRSGIARAVKRHGQQPELFDPSVVGPVWEIAVAQIGKILVNVLADETVIVPKLPNGITPLEEAAIRPYSSETAEEALQTILKK